MAAPSLPNYYKFSYSVNSDSFVSSVAIAATYTDFYEATGYELTGTTNIADLETLANAIGASLQSLRSWTDFTLLSIEAVTPDLEQLYP